MGILKKKTVEPDLSPGEMVSREADRVEQEIMVGLLETAVRNHLYDPFQMDTKIWFEPATMAYHVKLRVAGKDEQGKTYSLVFTGSIPEEHIIRYANDVVSWRKYMDITVRAWITQMTKDLKAKGATRLLVGGRRNKSYLDLKGEAEDLNRKIDAFSEATRRAGQSFDVLSEKMYVLGKQGPQMWVDDHHNRPPTQAEIRDVEESLRRSAERRQTS